MIIQLSDKRRDFEKKTQVLNPVNRANWDGK